MYYYKDGRKSIFKDLRSSPDDCCDSSKKRKVSDSESDYASLCFLKCYSSVVKNLTNKLFDLSSTIHSFETEGKLEFGVSYFGYIVDTTFL